MRVIDRRKSPPTQFWSLTEGKTRGLATCAHKGPQGTRGRCCPVILAQEKNRIYWGERQTLLECTEVQAEAFNLREGRNSFFLWDPGAQTWAGAFAGLAGSWKPLVMVVMAPHVDPRKQREAESCLLSSLELQRTDKVGGGILGIVLGLSFWGTNRPGARGSSIPLNFATM